MSKDSLKSENGLIKMLIGYYDELVLVQEDSSFLCDAFTSLMENRELISSASVNGFSRQADNLKLQIQSLKENLREILELVKKTHD